MENLNGNLFGSKMANGEYGEVSASIKSLRKVRDTIQHVINSFEWEDRKDIFLIESM